MRAAAAGAAPSHSSPTRSRKAFRYFSSPGGPPSSSRPRAAISCNVSRSLRPSASTNRPSVSRYVPNPTTTSRASATRATTSGQAARSRSTPFETISFPNVAHDAVTARIELREAPAPRQPHLPKRPSRRPRACRRAGSSRWRPRSSGRGRKEFTSTPGGPSRVRVGQRGLIGEHLPQAFGRVTRAHQHARRAANPL